MKDIAVTKDFLLSKIKEFDSNNSIGGFLRGAIVVAPFALLLFIYIGQLIATALLGLLLYVINRII